MSIGAQAGAPHKGPVRSFLTDDLVEMESELKLLQGPGALLGPYNVARWVRRCFEGPFERTTPTRYVGTDSHVPSEYQELYTDYLEAHETFIDTMPHSTSRRIMVNSMETLRTDRANEKASLFFASWHKLHKPEVTLYQLDKLTNRQMLEANGLHDLVDTDIGYWDNHYVLLFNPIISPDVQVQHSGQVRLRLAFRGDPLYEQCAQYVELLDMNPDVQELPNDDLPIYPPGLSHNWQRFALPDERLAQTGPLIEGVIERVDKPKQDVRIFDAATGVGFETVYLLKRGYFVQSNEIEASLREAADKYARNQGVPIPAAQFSSSDWLELENGHQAGQYDVVLVLGNSLCHLETTRQVEQVLKQFYRVLRPGGFLVCDERNFAKILREWDTIIQDPLNNFSYNNNPNRVMYRGTEVLGAPYYRDGNRVVFEYSEVKRADGRYQRVKRLGSLSMFAFSDGFLPAVLKKAGFATVETLCDLKFCNNNGRAKDQADFLTYVAQKSLLDKEPPEADSSEPASVASGANSSGVTLDHPVDSPSRGSRQMQKDS